MVKKEPQAYVEKGIVSLIIHSLAGHFWGRRAGHGIPDLKTPLENYFDLPLRCLACGQRITRGLLSSFSFQFKVQIQVNVK